MVKFDGRILQFGFGAVGKSFYEKLKYEVDYDEYKYFVLTKEPEEFKAYINLGGIAPNFITREVNKENYAEVFGDILGSGDLLIDFADTVGTRDIIEWCANHDVMYVNTGEADWPYQWYCIFEENEKKSKMKADFTNIKHPIVLQHGNNPGLVSHFVKAGLEYIVENQFKPSKLSGIFKRNKKVIKEDIRENSRSMLAYNDLKNLLNENKYNELAMKLGLKMIHVNDIDLQKVKEPYVDKKLYNTWCVETFIYEILSETAFNIGTHEKLEFGREFILKDMEKGNLKLTDMAVNVKCKTIYPGGCFDGYVVPHEETITIAKGLEVVEMPKEDEGEQRGKVIYRPTVMFVYQPCEYAVKYLDSAKVNEYPNIDPAKPLDCEDVNGKSIVHGYEYPDTWEIVYRENIESGTEYVGVLLIGDNFDPVWVGNRVEIPFLYKGSKDSYWQTPTITPVSMSALSAVVWMINNRDKGGIYFPDDIMDYKSIIKLAEKYISKTIYKTFSKEEVEEELVINIENLQFEHTLQ